MRETGAPTWWCPAAASRLGGHGGVAIGALSPGVVAQTPPLPGWMGAPLPFAFDATRGCFWPRTLAGSPRSTISYLSVVGLTAALDQLLTTGLEKIERHATRLPPPLADAVEDRGWQPFRHRGDPAAASHIISLGRPGESFDGVLTRLRGERVVCSAHGGRLRVSLAPYNDEDDIAALATALA